MRRKKKKRPMTPTAVEEMDLKLLNADMVEEIRRICDENGAEDHHFLDEAVLHLVGEKDKLKNISGRLLAGCLEFHRCFKCVGPLGANEISANYRTCWHCFNRDFEAFISTYGERLTQLPEPKPDAPDFTS